MESSDRNQLAKQVRTMQIIVVALATGILVFGTVVVLMGDPAEVFGDPEDSQQPFISYLGVAFGLMGVVMGVVLPRFLAGQMPATVETYQTTIIIAAALFEGPAFLNLIAYMLEGQAYSLAIAAMLMAMILMLMPTIGRVNEWLDNRARHEREQEMFGPRGE